MINEKRAGVADVAVIAGLRRNLLINMGMFFSIP
jgi:hypothetical protein